MKYIITIFAIFMVILNNFAQTDLVRYRPCNLGCETTAGLNEDFTYGGITTFLTEDVISDYGVRKITQKCG